MLAQERPESHGMTTVFNDYVHTLHKKKLLKFLHAKKKMIFITEFAILCKNPPFYEVKKIFQKRLSAFQSIFFYTTFHHRFLAENVEFRYIFHFDWLNDV